MKRTEKDKDGKKEGREQVEWGTKQKPGRAVLSREWHMLAPFSESEQVKLNSPREVRKKNAAWKALYMSTLYYVVDWPGMAPQELGPGKISLTQRKVIV